MKTLLGILVLAFALLAVPDRASGETIVGLTTGNQLFTFDSATPGSISAPVPVTGLLPATTLVGIDFRPVDQRLVGVVRIFGRRHRHRLRDRPANGGGDVDQHRLHPSRHRLRRGFQPRPERPAIAGNAGQNLRIVNGGTGTVDADSALNPGTPSVMGVPPTATTSPAPVTTLFDINNSVWPLS